MTNKEQTTVKTTRKKRTKDLPDTFCLDSYSESHTADENWWSTQLRARKLALSISLVGSPGIANLLNKNSFKIASALQQHKKPVRRVSASDIEQYQSMSNLPKNEPLDDNNIRYRQVIVDCWATDQAITNGVLDVVNEARMSKTCKKSSSKEKAITEVKLNKLLEYKVLPFLDLMIWENQQSKKIDIRILVGILFPEDETDPYKTYEKVKRFSLNCLNEDFLSELTTY